MLPPTPATPKFVNLPYEFWVGESAPVDTSVGQVRTEGFLEHEDVRFAIRHQHRKSGMERKKKFTLLKVFKVIIAYSITQQCRSASIREPESFASRLV